MPVFEYSALDLKGKTTKGVIDAESAAVARQKLRAGKIYPVAIQEVDRGSSAQTVRRLRLPRLVRLIKPRDMTVMTRQLATLVGAGFPLVSALDAMVRQTGSHPFKKVLAQIKDSVVEGSSFASALSRFPSAFPPLYVNMVRAGENSGTLDIVLNRLADTTERQQALSHRITSALAYPILMSIVAAAVLFLLLAFIVPSITVIFEGVDRVLPAPTRLLIALSDAVQHYWWLMIAVAGIAGIAFYRVSKTPRGRRAIDRGILSLPIVGELTVKLAVSRFARTLGSLLENGVSMLPALEIVKNMAGNQILAEAVETGAREVGKGRGLGAALQATNAFPDLPLQMIHIGEQSGALEQMLAKVADVYDSEVETTVLRLTSLLEPTLILVMGLVVAFIVLSICLPIFEMSELVVQ